MDIAAPVLLYAGVWRGAGNDLCDFAQETQSSRQHRLQLSQPLGDLGFEPLDVSDDLQWGTMLDLVVNDLYVAVQREVVSLGDDVGLWHTERLLRAGAVALRSRT